MSNVTTQEPQEMWYCEECEEFHEPGDEEPGYECNSCGEVFSRSNSHTGDNHQCPQCQKFASKLTNAGCPECGYEMETVQAVETDNGWQKVDDEVDYTDQYGQDG